MKNVIHIFGASGSGTSTLGRYISQMTGFAFMDTDSYYWLPVDPMYTEKRPVSERLAMMTRDIEKSDGAVISGSLCGWGDPLISYFTLALRISAPTPVRIERLRKREIASFGERIVPGGDMYNEHEEFIRWAKLYDDGDENVRSAALHDLWQKTLSCPVIALDGTVPAELNYKKITKYII